MKKKSTPLVDQHLKSLVDLQQAETDDFFYTRLIARMEKEKLQPGWILPLKPVWLVSVLFFFLMMNVFMITHQTNKQGVSSASTTTPVQTFAESYDQTISSYY